MRVVVRGAGSDLGLRTSTPDRSDCGLGNVGMRVMATERMTRRRTYRGRNHAGGPATGGSSSPASRRWMSPRGGICCGGESGGRAIGAARLLEAWCREVMSSRRGGTLLGGDRP